MNWLSQIFSPVVDLARDAINGWREERIAERTNATTIRQAEVQRDVAVIQSQAERASQGAANEHEWDMEAARQARTSWKDEWFTIMLSVPVILCFIPGGAPFAQAGFEAMGFAPDWYMYAFAAAVSFAFGIRHLVQLIPNRR